LLEPATVVEKGIAQAYEIQRRLRVWRPRRAAVMGAGTIGLLATLVLRLRGMEVTTFGLSRKPYRNADLIEALGGRYESTAETQIKDGARKFGSFDIIFEATGYSPVLGNKVMVGTVNANREYFESGVRDLAQAEAEYPGWLERLLTHPVKGLENYQELFEKLTKAKDAIKVFCEIAA
jgi:threonine dehydrogenase-like Zn-dependent dehydrogenase